jgi:hypothetical protein
MLYSPKELPRNHGFKAGDTHCVVNCKTNTAKAYDFKGNKLWEIPASTLAQDPNWRVNSGDTPPGLYKLGQVWDDRTTNNFPPSDSSDHRAFGWLTFDLVDLEGNEDKNGRAGICWHGGGSGCGWPGAWEPYQELFPTMGCVRSHNKDLQDYVLEAYNKGTVFVSVWQDDE